MESFLKQLQLKAYRRVLILFLVGILFGVGLAPVFSQSPASPHISQNWADAQELEERGREHYLRGKEHYQLDKAVEDWQKAVEDWQRAAQAFAALGEELKQAIILGNLSLVHQQLGEWEEAEKAIAKSLNLLGFKHDSEIPGTWAIPDVSTNELKILGSALQIYGRFWYKKEKPQRALYSWRLAAEIFENKLNAPQGLIESQINQVQALQALGLYQQAIKLLGSALRVNYEGSLDLDEDRQKFIGKIEKNLKQLPSQMQMKALLSLGEVLRALGDLENSQKFLQERLEVAKQLGSPEDITATQLSLGNTFLAWGNLERERQAPIKYEYVPWRCESIKSLDKLSEKIKNRYKKADNWYRLAILNESLNSKNNHYRLRIREKLSEEDQKKALSQSPSSATGIKAQLNLMTLLVKTGEWRDAEQLAGAIKLLDLPESRTMVYAEINFAQHLACLLPSPAEDKSSWDKVLRRIEKAFQDPRNSKDNLTSDSQDKFTGSFSPDNLGKLYEYLTRSLEQAIQDAKNLDEDKRANSYVFGNIGGLYEYLAVSEANCLSQQKQQETRTLNCRQKAQKLTQKALYLAQPSEASDIAYQWQWQLGRLLEAQRETEKAIAAYREAVETLESVRGDLLVINSDFRFSFRDQVEPVYRHLVDLLLSNKRISQLSPANQQKFLAESLYYLQSLQLAEVENFLGCDLENIIRKVEISQLRNRDELTTKLIEQINQVLEKAPNAALIYPIILPERIEVIVKLPREKNLIYYPTPPDVRGEDIRTKIAQLQLDLEEEYTFEDVKTKSEQIYEWLVQPVSKKLKDNQIKTLVFALDGPLRNIPMAALYDGEHYLIENYAVAEILGLQLPTPQPLTKERFRVLAAGLSEPPKEFKENFAPLRYVKDELREIENLGVTTVTVIRDEFDRKVFNEKINEIAFPVVHLATHGQFSSDPQKTFILDSKGDIRVNKLNNDLFLPKDSNRPEPIELLFLSACETAAGDNWSTLGIAGTLVRAGTVVRAPSRSVIASLWSLDDKSSVKFTREFYQQLRTGKVSRAEALRSAQWALLKDIRYEHPRYWAPYILVGNWL